MSFADLKKNQGTSGLKKLQEELESLNKKPEGSNEENMFWKLQTDKSGVGAAVIRFLPAAEGEDFPWVKVYEHAFKGPGGWYIEKSRTTLGTHEKDPVYEYNNQLWNSGVDANRELAKKQKRTLKYISNVLVVKDPANPDNEGKVFLFKYGKKIFEKIREHMNPESDPVDQKDPLNPFCPWKGANFKLKCRKVDGYPNYDQSDFGSQEALFGGDDDQIETLWKAQTKLSELVDPSKFKSYDDLKRRLDRVLGLSASVKMDAPTTQRTSFSERVDDVPVEDVVDTTSDNMSDDLSYLQQLANED